MSSKNYKKGFIRINKIWRESYNAAIKEERYLSKKKAKEDIYLGFSIFFATYAILYALYFLLYFKKSQIAGRLIYEIVGILIKSINFVLITSAVWFIVPFALYFLINLLIKCGNIKKIFYIIIIVAFFLAMPSLKIDKRTILNLIDLFDSETSFDVSKMARYVVEPVNLMSILGIIKKAYLLYSISFDFLKSLMIWYGDLFVWLSQIIVFLRMTLGGYLSVTASAVFSFFLTLSVAMALMPIQYAPGSDSFVPVAQVLFNTAIYIYIFIILNSIGALLKGTADYIIVSGADYFRGKTQKRKLTVPEETNNEDKNDNVTNEEKINENQDAYVTNKKRNETKKYYILIVAVIIIIFSVFFMRGEILKKSMPVTIQISSYMGVNIINITNETDYALDLEYDIVRKGKVILSKNVKVEAKETKNIGDSYRVKFWKIKSGDRIILKNSKYKDEVINIP